MSGETLGVCVGNLLRENGKRQDELAMEWLEAWKKEGGKEYSTATVPSRVSDLLADRARGLRFFFEDPKRAGTLLDLLDAPPQGRDELLALAEAQLSAVPADRPPRLVLDITSIGSPKAQLVGFFEQLEQTFLGEPRLRPMLMVLTDEQFEVLPRTWDKLGDDFRHEKLPPAGVTDEVIADLAGEHALVASTRPLAPYERWLALGFDVGRLVLEPPHGLQAYVGEGRLEVLPTVEHDLSDLGSQPLDEPVPTDGPGLRRLMCALGTEDGAARLGKPAGVRLAWARRLGVPASSTAQERVEHELSGHVERVGMPVSTASTAELNSLLSRARRRPVPAQLLRVGDELHALHPPEGVGNTGRLWVHRPTCRPPAFKRLLDEAIHYTEYDWLDDRDLSALAGQLDPRGKETGAFAHARATLLHNQRGLPPRAEPLLDPIEALGPLLERDPPAAMFRVRVVTELEQRWATMQRRALVRKPYAQPCRNATADQPPDDAYPLLKLAPPPGDLLLDRCRPEFECVSFRPLQNSWSADEVPSLLVPWVRGGLPPQDVWLDAMEASPALGADPCSSEDVLRAGGVLPGANRRAECELMCCPVPPEQWRTADRHVALAWAALRNALEAPQPIRLHDGTVLLRVRGGLFAELRAVRRHRPRPAVYATLLLPVEVREEDDGRCHGDVAVWNVGDFLSLVPTHRAQGHTSSDLGFPLPIRMDITGGDVGVSVTFVASPLHGAGEPGGHVGHFAQALQQDEQVREQEQRDEEERRRRDEEDDDD